jgi:hypothetical protein
MIELYMARGIRLLHMAPESGVVSCIRTGPIYVALKLGVECESGFIDRVWEKLK